MGVAVRNITASYHDELLRLIGAGCSLMKEVLSSGSHAFFDQVVQNPHLFLCQRRFFLGKKTTNYMKHPLYDCES